MIRIKPDVWQYLENSHPQGQKLNARQALPEISPRLLCALDSENTRHLMIPLNETEAGLNDRQTRGLYVITRELQVHTEMPRSYIDIVCRDSAGYDAFDLIAGDIASNLALNRKPADSVRSVLAKWRRFWGQMPLDILSRPEIIGLFSEIWFISQWLCQRIEPIEILKHWRGPFGARHDFEWQGRSIEVKATTSNRGRIFHINGLEQLEPPENGNLFLFGLILREESGASHTLASLIADFRTKIKDDGLLQSFFDEALVESGYSPAHDEHYERYRFRVVEEVLFSVSGNFPKIIRINFVNGSLSGIERVEYDINLSGFDHLIVARSPEEGDWI